MATQSEAAASDAYAMFSKLKPGDRVRATQTVRVGPESWTTTVTGTVLSTRRRRSGLHVDRADDDRVYIDAILLRRDEDGERTTVTLDENTRLERTN